MKKFIVLSIALGILVFVLSACMNMSSFNPPLFKLVASNDNETYLIEFDTNSATLLQSIDMNYYQYPLAMYNNQLVTVTKYDNYWTYTGYSITKSNFMQQQWSFNLSDYTDKEFVGFNGNELALISTWNEEFYVYSTNGSLLHKIPLKADYFCVGLTDKDGNFYAFYVLWDNEDFIYLFKYDPTANSTSILKLPISVEDMYDIDVYDPKIIGNYLYFGMEKGLYFFNIQNPTDIHHITTAGECDALNGFNNFLYIDDTQKGVDLINIATPTQAYIEKTFSNMQLSSGSLIYKNYLITYNYSEDGIDLYDISYPTFPEEKYQLNYLAFPVSYKVSSFS